MKLSKKQFCIAVETYRQMLIEERMIQDALNTASEWVPGDWINNYYDFLSDLCELEEDPYIGTDLDWYCFETDFGRRKDMCKVYDQETGRTWTIETPEILYDYITRDQLIYWDGRTQRIWVRSFII